jgi:hypothetical protein
LQEVFSLYRLKLQGRQNSEEAIKLIKENSEILGRLARHQGSFQEPDSPISHFSPSPTDPQDLCVKSKCPSVKTSQANKPITFNPFPKRQPKKPKEVGLKLGLYPNKK